MAPFDQAQSWWCRLSRQTRQGLMLATTACGLVVAVGPAWLALGLPIIATQHYVADEVDKVAKRIDRSEAWMIDGQIQTVEVRRTLVDKESFELDVALAAKPPLSEQLRATLLLRKRGLDDDRKNLDFTLDALQRARSGRRP